MSFSIQPVENKKVPALLELMQEFYQFEHLPFDVNVLNDCIHELISDERIGIIRFILSDNEVIGYFVLTFGYSLEFHGRDALLDEFYVKENFRYRGAGTQCLKYIEQFCKEQNIKAVHLEVDTDNLAAKDLYHKNGYKDHNRYLLTKWLIK